MQLWQNKIVQQQQQIHDNIRLTRNIGPIIHLAEFISQQLQLGSNVVSTFMVRYYY